MKGGGRMPNNSAAVNPIDLQNFLSREVETPSMGDPKEYVSETQVVVQSNEASEEVGRPGTDLPKDFYPIEAICAKRMRRGQKQYLIKWLDYPEMYNTWEPVANLQDVLDLIDAFEERSTKSEKQNKGKGKQVTHNTETKKLQRLSFNGTNTSLADVETIPQVMAFSDEGDNNGDASNHRKGKQTMVIVPTSVAGQIAIKKEEDDYDPTITELKQKSSTRANGREPVQNEPLRGAKRRKSGSVKRFIRAPHQFETVEQVGIKDNNGDIYQVKVDEDIIDVVKIIRPLKYSSPDETDNGEPFIFFEALRSNGAITVVSNYYLMESNPKLLAKYFQQNLRYNEA